MLDSVFLKRKIVITSGQGGVGKTSLSAAMGLRASKSGKKTLVVTMDPARRLATSLQLSQLGDLPHEVSPGFFALMPDTSSSIKSLVTRHAPSVDIADKILKNPIFEMLSKEFSGAQEYMILERLSELHQRNEYDLIVLDTPPSRNLLQFLESPTLLQKLFEERVFQWIAKPTNKILSFGVDKALGALEQVTGAGFMTQFLELSKNLIELQSRLMQSIGKVKELLESNDLGFLLIAGPYTDQVDELIQFSEAVKSYGLHFDGLIMNRSLTKGFQDLLDNSLDSFDHFPEFHNAREIMRALQSREQAVMARIFEKLGKPIALIPELARDVCGLEDLTYVSTLF